MNALSDILTFKAKEVITFKNSNINEAMKFGFSYMESEDHIVHYIVANSNNMKKILGNVEDSKIKIEKDSIGELWTAKLLISDKLNDDHILFSNNIFSAVVNLQTNKI